MLSGADMEAAMASGPGSEPTGAGGDATTAGHPPTPPQGPTFPPGPPVPPSSWQPDAWRRAGRLRIGGSLVAGLVLVMVGTYFLVRQVAPTVDVDRLWPFGAIGIGLVLLVAAVVAPERDR
jgi:hypothetical protein